MTTAGKYLAQDRGAFDEQATVDLPSPPPQKFPLAERLSHKQLLALFQLRSALRSIT